MTFETSIYLMGKDCSKSGWQKENKTALLKNDCMFSSKRSCSFPVDLFACVCHCHYPHDHFIFVRFNKLIIGFLLNLEVRNSRLLGILSQIWLTLWWLEDHKINPIAFNFVMATHIFTILNTKWISFPNFGNSAIYENFDRLAY